MNAGSIDGLVITELRRISDERGEILHMLRSDATDYSDFGECYFSEVKPGAVKAWKRHRCQTQNFAVPVGRVRLAVFDEQEGSSASGKLQVMELGRPDAYLRVRIPPGLWYGFECISDVPALVANCADMPHDPEEGIQLPADDPLFPHEWGIQRR